MFVKPRACRLYFFLLLGVKSFSVRGQFWCVRAPLLLYGSSPQFWMQQNAFVLGEVLDAMKTPSLIMGGPELCKIPFVLGELLDALRNPSFVLWGWTSHPTIILGCSACSCMHSSSYSWRNLHQTTSITHFTGHVLPLRMEIPSVLAVLSRASV